MTQSRFLNSSKKSRRQLQKLKMIIARFQHVLIVMDAYPGSRALFSALAVPLFYLQSSAGAPSLPEFRALWQGRRHRLVESQERSLCLSRKNKAEEDERLREDERQTNRDEYKRRIQLYPTLQLEARSCLVVSEIMLYLFWTRFDEYASMRVVFLLSGNSWRPICLLC